MNKKPIKYLIIASALMLCCLGSMCYVIRIHAEANAKIENAKYFSDLAIVEAAADAMKSYADQHKGYLPSSHNWEESIKPYRHDKKDTVSLREHPGTRLAMNSRLSGINIHQMPFVQPDGPILLYETHSNTKDATGLPPWKQYHQCNEFTKERLMLAFVSGWAYSYAEGSMAIFNKN